MTEKIGRRVVKRTAAAIRAETETITRAQGATAKVHEYLETHQDEHVWASDIMAATGYAKKQVQNAISYLRVQGGLRDRIAVIRPGNAWKYRSKIVVPAKERVTVSEPAAPYAGVDSAVQIKVVGHFENGTLALDINGEPYLARPA